MAFIQNKWVKKEKYKKACEIPPSRESSSPNLSRANMARTLRGVRK